MKAEQRRLDRLRRLERLRAVAKQQVAVESATAEGVYSQLHMLTDRTRRLASDYAARGDAVNGYELTQSSHFAAGLCRIVHSTQAETDTARQLADSKMIELAAAEQRRAAVEDRVERERRALAKRLEICVMAGWRKTGTEIE